MSFFSSPIPLVKPVMNTAKKLVHDLSYEASPVLGSANSETYTLEQAYAECQRLAQTHYENFPVASYVLPQKLRGPIAAVYTFARIADDFADEEEFADQAMVKLKNWEEQLDNCQNQTPTHPVFIALKDTIDRFKIPVELLKDLLTAFKMDVVVKHYQNFDQVLRYCRYSANPVGRIVLYIMGYPAPKFLEYSDSICTALQLTNFWQDIAVDYQKDRIYLPQDEMKRFRYSERDLENKVYNDAFRRLVYFQIDRARELFMAGKPLCTEVPGRLGLELRLTWLGGVTVLDKIFDVKADIFNRRPTLNKKDYIGIVLNALIKPRFKTKE